MRKWTYLVAVLLMAGTSTSLLTSCIDNDEPAGITDLRGAKAELLRAKAAVEQAEAAIKTAQVKWYEAEAEIKNQEAEQAKLKTSWLEAQYQAQKDSIQAETQKYVEQQNKLYIEALQASAEANAEYQKALAAIEAALVGVKESAYAERLEALINDESFTYTYEDSNGKPQTITANGIKGILNSLESAQNDLAELRRAESQLKFSFSKEAKIAAVQSQINIETGKLEGLKENLEELKTIKGVALSDWKTKYEEYETKDKELRDEYSQLLVQQEEALQVVAGKKDSLNNANKIEKVFAFSIPDEIASAVHKKKWGITGKTDKNKSVNAWAYEGSTPSEYTFPNKIELKLNLEERKELLVGTTPDGGMVDDLESVVLSETELSAAQASLETNKNVADQYIKADGSGVYDKAVKEWKNAMKAFHDQFNLLTDPANNKRKGIIDTYEDYNDALQEAKDDAAKKTLTDNFKKALNDYVAERSKLDGWLPITGQETFDATKDADWTTWSALTTNDERFGQDVTTNMTPNNGGLWKTYTTAADKIGYIPKVDPIVPSNCDPSELTYIEYTYDQFKADFEEQINGGEWEDALTRITIKGYTKTAFTAKYTAEKVQEQIDTQDAWKALQKEILALYDAYKTDQTNSDKVEGEILAQENTIKSEWSAKLYKLNQQMAGLSAIMQQILNVINEENGGNEKTYEKAIEWIETQIAYLEGGSIGTTEGETGYVDYNFVVTGKHDETTWTGIPAQEAIVKSYESLKAAIESGEYKLEEETAMENIAARIKAQDSIVKGWEAILAAANKTKDQLMAALTGESGGTEVPETPEEGGEETPAE